MWFAIIGEDVSDSLSLRKQLRPAHLERIQELHRQGRVLIAGPHPKLSEDDSANAGFSGSLMVVDFPDLAQAKAWANDDPYTQGGVFESVLVKPFIQAVP